MSVRSRRPAPSLTSLRKSFIEKDPAVGHTHGCDEERAEEAIAAAAVAPRRVCVSWMYLSPLARAMASRASAGHRASRGRRGAADRDNDKHDQMMMMMMMMMMMLMGVT